jgi:HD-GYP domain-containing protein (c-di-GMP phosphodiesterase class II)
VYDALLSKRSYKESWQVQDALAEIERSSGSHFDPQLVDAFLRLAPTLTDELDAVSATDSPPTLVEPAPA